MIKNIMITTLLLCSLLFAANEDADAVYQKIIKEYQLKANGDMVYHHSHRIKLLSYMAFSGRYGETFIVYNPEYQKLNINRSETTMRDGTVVPSPENAFNEVLPRFARDAAAYNHLREMVVTHTGLEVGAVIDLEYAIETKSGFLHGLMAEESLAGDAPIEELIIRVIIPQDKNLNYQLFGSDVEPVKRSEGGNTVYEWTFQNLDAIVYESLRTHGAALVFSTVDDWDTALQPLHEAYRKNALPAKLISDLSGQTTRSAMEQVLQLQKTIVNEMATFPVPLAAIGYRFRNSADVWLSNGGTELEKAVLMADVLTEMGIKARPVLVSGTAKSPGEVVCLPAYHKAVVCVDPDSSQKYFLSVDDLNDVSLVYRHPGHQVLPLSKSEKLTAQFPGLKDQKNVSAMQAHIQMNKSGENMTKVSLELSGAANPYLKIQRDGGDPETLFKRVCRQELKSVKLRQLSSEQMRAEAEFSGAPEMKAQESYRFLSLMENPYGIAGLNLPTLTQTRYSALELPYNNFSEKYNLTIEIPDNMSLVTEAVDIEEVHPAGKVVIKISSDENQINIKRQFVINEKVISKEAYPDFLKLWRLWQAPNYRELVFREN